MELPPLEEMFPQFFPQAKPTAFMRPVSTIPRSRIQPDLLYRHCRVLNCTKAIQSRGRCFKHGGGPRCQLIGCLKARKDRGYCIKHGKAIRGPRNNKRDSMSSRDSISSTSFSKY